MFSVTLLTTQTNIKSYVYGVLNSNSTENRQQVLELIKNHCLSTLNKDPNLFGLFP
jgi:hypothetical protein